MSLQNTPTSYGRLSRVLHWATALLILAMIPLGFVAEQFAHALNVADTAPTESQLARTITLFSIHKTIGVLVFFLALIRVIWMLTQIKPALLHTDRKLESFAAELVHFLLYGALVLVPLTGWVHHAATTGFAPIWWPFGQTLPFVPKSPEVSALFSTLHGISVWVLIGSLVLHIAGALKHHLIDRDITLLRMLRGHSGGTPQAHRALFPALVALGIWAVATVGSAVGITEKSSSQPSLQLAQVSSDWIVQDGNLAISIQQMGATVSGSFADWTAQISYTEDPTQQKNGEITVTVSIPSLTLGSVTQQAMAPDYFDADKFPTAVFKADILRQDGGLVAEGLLTIKDQSVPLSLPFDLQVDGNTAIANGQTSTNRLDFGIGQSVTDAGTLGFLVGIEVSLTANRN